MKIAIITDKTRKGLIPLEESVQEDNQKEETMNVIQSILSSKYDTILLQAHENIIHELKEEKVDLVFNLCNGIIGESKLAQLPAILEYAGIPYTGSSILGHALAINKIYSSKIFQHLKIPTPNFYTINTIEDIKNLDIEYPVLIKPNDEGSSRGIHQDSLIFNSESLFSKTKELLEIYKPPIMLNEYIQGREFSIGVIGNGEDIFTLPIQEVDLSNLPEEYFKFYSFEVKTYLKDNTIYHVPAKVSKEEEDMMNSVAKQAYQALHIKDYGRVDIILRDGVPYVLEINSLPGLMKYKSALYRMAEHTDLGYDNLILLIVENALKRYNLT